MRSQIDPLSGKQYKNKHSGEVAEFINTDTKGVSTMKYISSETGKARFTQTRDALVRNLKNNWEEVNIGIWKAHSTH